MVITASLDLITITAQASGTARITQQGRLRLHQTIRLVSEIYPAQRRLLVGYLNQGLLTVYTMNVLSRELHAYHARHDRQGA